MVMELTPVGTIAFTAEKRPPKFGHRWKRRHFTLSHDGILRWYESSGASTPRGELPTASCQVTYNQVNLEVSLTPVNMLGKTYCLRFPTFDQLLSFHAAVLALIHNQPLEALADMKLLAVAGGARATPVEEAAEASRSLQRAAATHERALQEVQEAMQALLAHQRTHPATALSAGVLVPMPATPPPATPATSASAPTVAAPAAATGTSSAPPTKPSESEAELSPGVFHRAREALLTAAGDEESTEAALQLARGVVEKIEGVSGLEPTLAIVRGLTEVAAQIPMVGPLVNAMKGLFKAFTAVRVLKKEINKFHARIQLLTATVTHLLKQLTATHAGMGAIQAPPQLQQLHDLLTAARDIVTKFTKRGFVMKVLQGRSDAGKLAELDVELTKCVQDMQAGVTSSGLELQHQAITLQQASYKSLMAFLEAVESRVKSLGGSDEVFANPKLLEDMSSMLGSNQAAIVDEIRVVTEATVAAASKKLGGGSHTALKGSTMAAMWQMMCGQNESVTVELLVSQLQRFLVEELKEDPESVNALFGDGNSSDVVAGLDVNGDGRVSVMEVSRTLCDTDKSLYEQLEALAASAHKPLFVAGVESAPEMFGYTLEMGQVQALFVGDDERRVFTVSGDPNSGMSTFLQRAAFGLRGDALGGGVVFVDAAGAQDGDDVIVKIARDLGLRVESSASTAFGVWCELQTKRARGAVAVLVAVPAGVDAVPSLSPFASAVVKFAVSCGEGGDVALSGLDAEAGLALVEARAPHLVPYADQVGAMCSWQPLSMVRLCALDPGMALRLLEGFKGGATPDTSSADAEAAALSEVSDAARQALSCLSMMGGATFEAAGAAAVCDMDTESVLAALEELVSAGECQQHSSGSDTRWSVRGGRGGGDGDNDAALLRLVRHYGAVLDEAETLFKSKAVMSGLFLFDTERGAMDVLVRLGAACPSQSRGVQEALLNMSASRLLGARVRLEVLGAFCSGLLTAARAVDPSSLTMAAKLSDMALVLKNQGKLDEALGMYEEALAIKKTAFGKEHAATLSNMAGVLKTQGKLDEALGMYEETLGILKTAFWEIHPAVATTIYSMASVLEGQGKLDEAWGMYEEALDIRKKAYGEEHPDVAATLNNMGDMVQRQGKLDEALGMYREALAIQRTVYGEEHPDVAATLNSTVSVLENQGKLDEALGMYEDAPAIRKKAYGEEHPTVRTLYSMASVLGKQGKLDEALVVYEKVLAMKKKAFGEEHPDVAGTLNNVALVLEKQGKLDEALAMYEDALAIRKRAYGEEHPEVAATLNSVAGVLEKQGKLDEALAMSEEALAIMKKAYGEEHALVGGTLINIIISLKAQGKLDEALGMYEEVLAIRKKAYGELHPAVARTLNDMATVLSEQGKLDEALGMYEEALGIMKKAYGGEEHPEVTATLSNIARVLKLQGKLGDALLVYEAVLAIRKIVWGDDHSEVADVLEMMASLRSRLEQ